MRKIILALALALGAAATAPVIAEADTFDFSYVGTAGSGIDIIGVLTTGMADPAGSFYTPSLQITGLTIDGAPDDSLSPAGTSFNNDNILYYPSSQKYMGQKTYLDLDGLAFSTPSGEINLFFGLGGYGEINTPTGGSSTSDIGGTFKVTEVSAAPEPSVWALLFVGVGAIGLMLRRKKASGPDLRYA